MFAIESQWKSDRFSERKVTFCQDNATRESGHFATCSVFTFSANRRQPQFANRIDISLATTYKKEEGFLSGSWPAKFAVQTPERGPDYGQL